MATEARGNMRDQQKELTRQRLKEAALRCFVELGYQSTSVSDITTAAGATRATFYRHYKSKAELVEACLDELDETYRDSFADLGGLLADPDQESLRSWLSDAFAMWRKTRDVSVIVGEAASAEREIELRRQRSFEFETNRIAVALTNGSDRRPEQAMLLAELLFTQLRGTFEVWARRDSDLDLDQAASVMAAMWWAALSTTSDLARHTAS
jgi:AcrR family transcriptional regulator